MDGSKEVAANSSFRDLFLDLLDKDLNVDLHKFFTIGNSAGGHLSKMMLLTPKDKQYGDPSLVGVDYTIVAGVSWYG